MPGLTKTLFEWAIKGINQMQIKETMRCFGIKESKGTFEGKEFSSTTFHLEATLAENSAGRSLGIVTRPFKFGDATEFDKWSKIPDRAFPINVEVVFTVNAGSDNGVVLKLVDIKPAPQTPQKATANA